MGMMFSPTLLSYFHPMLIHSCTLHLCKAAARSWFAPRGIMALILVACHMNARCTGAYLFLQLTGPCKTKPCMC